MKISKCYVYTIISVLFVITGCSNAVIASRTDRDFFINRTKLFMVEGSDVKCIGDIWKDSFLSPEGLVSWVYGTELDRQLLFFLDRKPSTGIDLTDPNAKCSVYVYKIGTNDSLSLLHQVIIPEGQSIKTTAISKNILFVTGKLGEHILGFYDLAISKPVFTPIEIPDKVKNKVFDDLIVDGKTLIAIDNVFRPKWLVVYDISNPDKPEPVKVNPLMAGVNEHIEEGVIGSNYMALFCESGTMGGRSQSIQIYDKTKEFAPVAAISLWSSNHRGESTGYKSNPTMSFAGDLLLLSGYGGGVGVLDCSALDGRGVIPDRLFCKNKKGKEQLALSAVSLSDDDRVAVWLTSNELPIIVGTDKLLCHPQKKVPAPESKQDEPAKQKMSEPVEESGASECEEMDQDNTSGQTKNIDRNSKFRIYTVTKDDDNLYGVARMWCVSAARLKELNELSDTKIIIGQKLMIPV